VTKKQTRNQYASPPRQCNTGRPLKRFFSNFYKVSHGRVSQVRSLTPNFTVVALKCGLTGVKIAKIGNFWYNFVPKGHTPYAIFTKFGMGRNSQARTLVPNLTIVTFKMWAYNPPKSPKLVIFGINLPKKGIPP